MNPETDQILSCFFKDHFLYDLMWQPLKAPPLLILKPTLSRYHNAIVGTILQNWRFATLGA